MGVLGLFIDDKDNDTALLSLVTSLDEPVDG